MSAMYRGGISWQRCVPALDARSGITFSLPDFLSFRRCNSETVFVSEHDPNMHRQLCPRFL